MLCYSCSYERMCHRNVLDSEFVDEGTGGVRPKGCSKVATREKGFLYRCLLAKDFFTTGIWRRMSSRSPSDRGFPYHTPPAIADRSEGSNHTTIVIHITLVRHGNRQDVFCLFLLMVSVVDIIQRSCSWFPSLIFCMVSVVTGKRFVMVAVAGCSMDSAVAGGFNILEPIEWFLVLGVFRIGFRRWLFDGFRRGKKRLFMVSVVGCFVYGFRLLQDRGSLSDGNHKQTTKTSGRFRDELSI